MYAVMNDLITVIVKKSEINPKLLLDLADPRILGPAPNDLLLRNPSPENTLMPHPVVFIFKYFFNGVALN